MDFAPNLFLSWGQDFRYFGSEGKILAAHSGKACHVSECKLSITGHGIMTYYSHIRIIVDNWAYVRQGDVIGLIDTRRKEAQCECDVVYGKPRSYVHIQMQNLKILICNTSKWS